MPRLSDLQPHRAAVEAVWVHMRNHQLPALLAVNSFWDALAEIFDWLHGQVLAPVLAPMTMGANALIRGAFFDLPAGSSGQSFIEMIRFASANRLLVEIDYREKKGVRSARAIEAYSLRRSQAGDVLLMAARADSGQASLNLGQIAYLLEKDGAGVQFRLLISLCKTRENWRTRHDSNV